MAQKSTTYEYFVGWCGQEEPENIMVVKLAARSGLGKNMGMKVKQQLTCGHAQSAMCSLCVH